MNHVIRRAALVTMLLSMGSPSHATETVTGKQAIEKASAIFKEVIRRREAIQSIEFTATITCDVFRYPTPEVDRAFEGATAKYHFWISPKVSRVDLDEIRPLGCTRMSLAGCSVRRATGPSGGSEGSWTRSTK